MYNLCDYESYSEKSKKYEELGNWTVEVYLK